MAPFLFLSRRAVNGETGSGIIRQQCFAGIVLGRRYNAARVVANPSPTFRAFVLATVLGTAVVLAAGRLHPTPLLHLFGGLLATITLLLHVRIVLLVMFRAGPVTWSRIQGRVCAYLLLGMAWASGFQFLEQLRPGSFHFVSAPADLDLRSAATSRRCIRSRVL
jgi:hypothetical protein